MLAACRTDGNAAAAEIEIIINCLKYFDFYSINFEIIKKKKHFAAHSVLNLLSAKRLTENEMKPIAPNTLIQNRYLIVHLIGKGGMGEVYLAVDQRLGSAIALKRTFFSDDATLGNAFEREARTLARLRHPVLPKVSDHFTEEGKQYLVMDHIAGEDISKRLESMQKPFPISWVLFWADQLLDALTYLHTNEPPIIHRDIKPQNLKLTDENHIVLLDFGLSKNTLGDTRVSTTGSVVGYTPHYAPMEQIRGTGTDARSDI